MSVCASQVGWRFIAEKRGTPEKMEYPKEIGKNLLGKATRYRNEFTHPRQARLDPFVSPTSPPWSGWQR